MSNKRDYYDVLEVSSSANAEEIRAAHRRLARKYHPDMNKEEDASSRFAEIQEAYDVLNDKDKRAQYDQYGHAGVGGNAQGHPGAGAAGGWSNVDPDTFEDIFGDVFGGRRRGQSGFGDFGSDFDFNAGPGAAKRPAKGQDIELDLEVGFATAAFGGTEQLRMGTNTGDTTTIEVKIPAGAGEGSTLRVRGKGHPGANGGSNGDLLLHLLIGAHPWFTRDGLDLAMTVPISIAEAALGGKVRVPLLKGTATLTVPAGISSGGRLRLKGKGITDTKGHSGDLHAVIDIVAPKNISETNQTILKQLAEELPDPRAEVPWAAEIKD